MGWSGFRGNVGGFRGNVFQRSESSVVDLPKSVEVGSGNRSGLDGAVLSGLAGSVDAGVGSAVPARDPTTDEEADPAFELVFDDDCLFSVFLSFIFIANLSLPTSSATLTVERREPEEVVEEATEISVAKESLLFGCGTTPDGTAGAVEMKGNMPSESCLPKRLCVRIGILGAEGGRASDPTKAPPGTLLGGPTPDENPTVGENNVGEDTDLLAAFFKDASKNGFESGSTGETGDSAALSCCCEVPRAQPHSKSRPPRFLFGRPSLFDVEEEGVDFLAAAVGRSGEEGKESGGEDVAESGSSPPAPPAGNCV